MLLNIVIVSVHFPSSTKKHVFSVTYCDVTPLFDFLDMESTSVILIHSIIAPFYKELYCVSVLTRGCFGSPEGVLL